MTSHDDKSGNSLTPRTDALLASVHPDGPALPVGDMTHSAARDFARQLERELAEAKAIAERQMNDAEACRIELAMLKADRDYPRMGDVVDSSKVPPSRRTDSIGTANHLGPTPRPSLAAPYTPYKGALEAILKLHPNVDLPDGSDWTAANCFHMAQEIARASLKNNEAPQSPQAPQYDAVADAVQEIADAAEEAFKKAGLTDPGEWDSDNIVEDVKRGIVSAIGRLAARSHTAPPMRVGIPSGDTSTSHTMQGTAVSSTAAKEYAERNPLGGPAKVFDAIAERLRAGEEYHAVLADYGLAVSATSTNREIAAVGLLRMWEDAAHTDNYSPGPAIEKHTRKLLTAAARSATLTPTAWIATTPKGNVLHMAKEDGWQVDVVQSAATDETAER